MQVDTAPLRSRFEALLTHRCSLYLSQVLRCDAIEGGTSHALTEMGQERSKAAFAKGWGIGSAPAMPDGYVCQVRGQSQARYLATASAPQEAAIDHITDEELSPGSWGALNTGQVVDVHDESGSGKTCVAENLVKTLQSPTRIPHAVYVEGEVIRLVGATAYRAIEEVASARCGLSHDAGPEGHRLSVKHPEVITGVALTRSTVECERDSAVFETEALDFVTDPLSSSWRYA